MDLVSSAERAEYAQAFQDIAQTFSRDIFIFKQDNRIEINTTPEYNFLYRESQQFGASTFTTQIVSGIFPARVEWSDPTREDNFRGLEVDPTIAGNYCRLKLTVDALNFISGAEQLWVDGKPCQRVGNIRPHGLFNPQFYTIFVKEREMDVNG